MDKWSIVLSVLSTQRMSYPSRKCDHCQSKISSSCYICDWCESRKMGGRGSPKLPTPMVESFFADLPAIKCYWTESAFEMCMLFADCDTKLLYIMPLLQEWGEEMIFLCMCSRNCIIIVIINITVYFVVVMVRQNRQVNGPNICKHEISDSLHHFIFFILFYYKVTYRSTSK